MNKYARQRGRILIFQDILYGYRRVDPLHNADYVLDILLTYKKFKGRRVSIPVRRHAYLQQSFAQLLIIDEYDYSKFDSIGNGLCIEDDERYYNKETGSATVNFPLEMASRNNRSDLNSLIINFIMPLCGRPIIFKRFLLNYEKICWKKSTKLTVVLFSSTNSTDDEQILMLLNEYRTKYTSAFVDWVKADGPFSRGLGLSRGASLHSETSLMFFTDVDMIFNETLLHRIRLNTIRGKQIFFPIVYSEYDPRHLSSSNKHNNSLNSYQIGEKLSRNHFVYDSNSGYFRHFGFGLVSLYKSDLDSIGGFDLNLKGWGMEDVDLFDKFVKHTNLSLFRAPEPSLIHVYHIMECSKTLNRTQYEMCLGSKGSSIASVYNLYDIISFVDFNV